MDTLNAVPIPPKEKSKVAIKMLIPDNVITEHSELLTVYDQTTETITYDVDSDIPKEFIENLEQLVPQFHGNDIVLFNPLIETINELQRIKSIAYNPDDFEASDRLYIDNNKIIGSSNTSIKEAKAALKNPQIAKNKLIDKIFELFENEIKNTRGALEMEFKPLLDEREKQKKAKENAKKTVELEAIANLSSTNTLLEEQLKNQAKATAVATAENAINSILTNIAVKLPNLNKEGLEQLKTNVAGIDFNMYVALELQNSFTADEIAGYQTRFKENRAAGVKNIEMAINALDLNTTNQSLSTANAVLQAQVPNPENIETSFEQVGGPGMNDVSYPNIPGPLLNDAQLFNCITKAQSQILMDYRDMIDQSKLIQFANPQVAELRDKLVNDNFPKIEEWLEKISTFCDKKQELVNQHFNK